MKMMNFRRLDPTFQRAGKKGLQRGNKDEAGVWNEFAGDRTHLAETASAIRATLAKEEDAFAEVDDVTEAPEGRLLTRLHVRRERSRNLVEAKKRQVLSDRRRLECEACGFDFEERYGARGRGFIEVHHLRPVHQLAKGFALDIPEPVGCILSC